MQEENLVFAMENCRTISEESKDLSLKIYHAYSDTETDTFGNPKAVRYVVRSTFGGDYSAGRFELDDSETVTRKIYSLGAARNSQLEGAVFASPNYSLGITEFRHDDSHYGKRFDIDVIKRGIFTKTYLAEIRSGGLGGVTLGYNCEVVVNRINDKH